MSGCLLEPGYGGHRGCAARRSPRSRDSPSITTSGEVLYLDDGQRMTVYQAKPGSRDHDALTLLSMIASRDEPENAAR